VKPNIGILNALMRITIGLTVLAWSTSKFTRRPYRDSYMLMAFLGAMKVAEGILKYCPITDLFQHGKKMNEMGLDSIAAQTDDDKKKQKNSEKKENLTTETTYNPS
jgi:hypothetical protein